MKKVLCAGDAFIGALESIPAWDEVERYIQKQFNSKFISDDMKLLCKKLNTI